MTTHQKIQLIKNEIPGISDAEAKANVKIINWLTKWGEVLEYAHKQFIIDTKEEMPFMEFAMWMYSNDKNFPKEYLKNISKNN